MLKTGLGTLLKFHEGKRDDLLNDSGFHAAFCMVNDWGFKLGALSVPGCRIPGLPKCALAVQGLSGGLATMALSPYGLWSP